MMIPSIAKTCPSAPAMPGAQLFGILDGSGQVSYLPQALEVTPEFIKAASEGREAEKRFRFAAPCVQERCMQWRDGRCGVPEMTFFETGPDDVPYRCAIRSSCRWFDQDGVSACRRCRFIAMKGNPTDTLQPQPHEGLE